MYPSTYEYINKMWSIHIMEFLWYWGSNLELGKHTTTEPLVFLKIKGGGEEDKKKYESTSTVCGYDHSGGLCR
jgi:hypothetical protein